MTAPPPSIQRYLNRQACHEGRDWIAGACDGIDQAVIIPAFAESKSILETLSRLAQNDPAELERTMVICVVNNRKRGVAASEDIEDNQQTVSLLRRLIQGASDACSLGKAAEAQYRRIISSGLRLACLDASSEGMEMPEKGGGVGMARKLGLDRALRLFEYKSPARKLLLNLDADTWVEPRYLSVVRESFRQRRIHAAVVAFSHRPEAKPDLQAAICCYELFLRYYVMGLKFAGSPYAFHSVGSTMVCTPESYVAVGGMNRREAAEDFYFLNKLAKWRPVVTIGQTVVHPSARPSRRVRFGTGQRVIRYLEGRQNEYLLYDPRVFGILRDWLGVMASCSRRPAPSILTMAMHIHPLLRSFLDLNRFGDIWPRIQKNHPETDALARQFHVWFDGFKTMKLLHYLTEKGFPREDMFVALNHMLKMQGLPNPVSVQAGTRPNLRDQIDILNEIRLIQSSEDVLDAGAAFV